MTVSDSPEPSPDVPVARGVMAEIVSRFRGPGGYYNVGNLIGLGTGLALQLSTAATSTLTGADVVVAYFVGSPATVALTVATIIFLMSGEMYHRAWRENHSPDPDLTRLADMFSAAGGFALAISLLYLGQPMLAIFTGLLVVLGKLGSAVFGDHPESLPFWPPDWPDLFRSMVLAGRIPAMAAAGLELWHQVALGTSDLSAVQPAVMVLCHLLWIRADMLLFRSGTVASKP